MADELGKWCTFALAPGIPAVDSGGWFTDATVDAWFKDANTVAFTDMADVSASITRQYADTTPRLTGAWFRGTKVNTVIGLDVSLSVTVPGTTGRDASADSGWKRLLTSVMAPVGVGIWDQNTVVGALPYPVGPAVIGLYMASLEWGQPLRAFESFQFTLTPVGHTEFFEPVTFQAP